MLQKNLDASKFNAHDGKVLSATQKEDYLRDGFLVIENFVSTDICELLMSRARELVNQFTPSQMKTAFSSTKQTHVQHQYFLDSADKVHFFFEEGAFDQQGELTAEKSVAINKIGHGLHEADPIFNCFSRRHKLAELSHDLDIVDPRLVQSMYIFKQPFIGGEVNCHQDATYLYVKGQPVTGLWFALEDATLENGCLWAIPGGHNTALKSRFIIDENNNTKIENYDDTPWELNKMIPLEVPQGSLIVLHGLLPHMSKENTSPRSRHAYTLHVFSGQDEFAKDNWLKKENSQQFHGFL